MGNDNPLGHLRSCVSRHWRLRRCARHHGEIPVHFITLTTAIFHWADLAKLLREYEERSTALREGRRDPLEPVEERIPENKRRVLHYIGVAARL